MSDGREEREEQEKQERKEDWFDHDPVDEGEPERGGS